MSAYAKDPQEAAESLVSLLEEAENKIAELTSKVEEQQKLILKLEDDILKVALLAPVIIHILPIDPIVF